MRKAILFANSLLLLGFSAIAQSVSPCGFDIVHQKMMYKNHNYENAVREADNRWVKSIISPAGGATYGLTYTPAGYVYEVPMVMHILHTGGAVGSIYNPDSTKVAQMLDYMNKAYAAVSPFPDTTAGGCRIPLKFVLAKRAPDGTATNGILRLDASSITNYSAKGANANNTDGVDDNVIMAFSRWNPADYYNVYIVNKIDSKDLYSTGGIAGFAYFPGNPTVDGMIVCASQVKSGSTTIAHEFGHAFSLYHTFQGEGYSGGTYTCPPTAPCATTGDLVCDTEPHYRSAAFPSWCPPTDVNPCTGGSYKNVQKNIMDYTTCPPNRFTLGQRARVLNILNNERSGYKSSLGAVAPTGTVKSACVPTSSGSTAAMGPVKVTFNTIEVWTGALYQENSAYVDHSYAQQTYVEPGKSYPISIETRTNRQNVKVFIDYNNDGDFSDVGEEVYSHNGTSATETHTGSITIPATATTCTWLRMRVVSAWYAATITDWACGPYANNAQAEDYAVKVQGRTSADSVTIAITAGSNPSCLGSSVTFTATPGSGTPTYQWYVNGKRNGVTTNTFTSSTLNNKDIITCKTFYTGACGSDSSESEHIQLFVSAAAVASANNGLIVGSNPGCPGQKLVFKAIASGAGSTPTYSWRRNGVAVGVTTDSFVTSTLSAGDKIHCVVNPGGAGTCSLTPVNSDTIVIAFATLTSSNTIGVTSGTNPSCDSIDIEFTTTPVNGGSTPTYQWYINNTAVAGANAVSFLSSIFKDGDTVSCRVVSNNPCVIVGVGDTSWSNKVVVKRLPPIRPTLSVSITKGSNPGCLDSLLEFTATATDGGGAPILTWYKNSTIATFGNVYGSTGFADGDTISLVMTATPASCNTVSTLNWGPEVLNLVPTPAAPKISLIGSLLVSSVPSGIQWYGPHGLIPGAITGTYHPTDPGTYYATLVSSGCHGGPSNYIYVSLKSEGASISPITMSNLKIYPNPTINGIVSLDWGADKANGIVEVYTLTGQRVSQYKIENESIKTLDLKHLSNGNYIIVIHDQNGKIGTMPLTIGRQ